MSNRPIEDNLETDRDKEILYSDDNDSESESESETGSDKTEEEEGESDEPDTETEEDEGTDEDKDESNTDEEDKDEDKDSKLDEKVGAPLSGRPTYRQVIDEFPKLFKKFPGLRDVFFRERDFSRIYATIEDAQESYDQLTRLRAGEQVISNGNPKEFLEILKDYDSKKEERFVSDFLPMLFKTNRPAFQSITEPVIQHALRSMHREAKRNGNENLATSALNSYEWLFGNADIDAEPRRGPAPHDSNTVDPEKEQLRSENQRLMEGRHSEFMNTALNTASKRIDSIVSSSLPEGTNEFEKKAIVREVMDRLGSTLRSDSAHRSNMDRLIRKGRDERYSAEARERLTTAYLSRAKLALPEIIKKVKSEALKDRNAASSKPRQSVPTRPNGSNGKIVTRVRKEQEDAATQVKKGKMSERAFLES